MPEEKIYTIPLRDAYGKAMKKRAPYAARLVRNYIRTHAKVETVKMGSRLNEQLWQRGITKPPRFVRVKVVKEDAVAKAELLGHDYREFRAKPREEKAAGMKEKLLERMGPKALKKEEEEKKIEGKIEGKTEGKEAETEKAEEAIKEEAKAEK